MNQQWALTKQRLQHVKYFVQIKVIRVIMLLTTQTLKASKMIHKVRYLVEDLQKFIEFWKWIHKQISKICKTNDLLK